jgi:hypothetical protein
MCAYKIQDIGRGIGAGGKEGLLCDPLLEIAPPPHTLSGPLQQLASYFPVHYESLTTTFRSTPMSLIDKDDYFPITCTVKPVLRDHLWDKDKVAL